MSATTADCSFKSFRPQVSSRAESRDLIAPEAGPGRLVASDAKRSGAPKPTNTKTRFLDSREIHARVNWRELLPRRGIAEGFLNGKHGPCPICGGTDRFRFDDKDGRGTFICSHCGAGDGFRLLELFYGCDFMSARKMVMEAAGLSDEESTVQPLSTSRSEVVPAKLEWSPTAEAIWRKTQGLRRTLGEVYLRSRSCVLPPRDSHLRYLPPDGNYPPSLCAAITDAVTGKPLSLHFTRLAADGCGKAGTGKDKLLLGGHRKAGGVIRLWPDECVTYGLSIAEGIETSLAAAHGAQPIWSTIDAGNLAAFRILPGIQSLTIFGDNDEAGRRAANACAERWATVAEVMIVCPDEPGFDIADAVAA
jgi:putative DNA primase/helicase